MNAKINSDGHFEYDITFKITFNPDFGTMNEINLVMVLERMKQSLLKQFQEDLEEYGS